MSFESGLVSYLKAHAGLNALIGQRVYPLHLPQGAGVPAVVYQKVSPRRRVRSHTGRSGLVQARYQLSAWGQTYKEALDVGAQLFAALDEYAGAMGTETVEHSRVDNEVDMYEPETGLYRELVEVVIWHQE